MHLTTCSEILHAKKSCRIYYLCLLCSRFFFFFLSKQCFKYYFYGWFYLRFNKGHALLPAKLWASLHSGHPHVCSAIDFSIAFTFSECLLMVPMIHWFCTALSLLPSSSCLPLLLNTSVWSRIWRCVLPSKSVSDFLALQLGQDMSSLSLIQLF